MPFDPDKAALASVSRELTAVRHKYPGPFHTPHEGYAIMLEEVDELWAEVKKKPKNRSKRKMRGEAKQIAAIAIRFITDLCEG